MFKSREEFEEALVKSNADITEALEKGTMVGNPVDADPGSGLNQSEDDDHDKKKETMEEYLKRDGKVKKIKGQKTPKKLTAQPTKSVRNVYNTGSDGYKKGGKGVDEKKGKVNAPLNKSVLVKALMEEDRRESAILLQNWDVMDMYAETMAKGLKSAAKKWAEDAAPAQAAKKVKTHAVEKKDEKFDYDNDGKLNAHEKDHKKNEEEHKKNKKEHKEYDEEHKGEHKKD